MDNGRTCTAGGRQEPHHAHHYEKYDKVSSAVDRTRPFVRRSQTADARAVAVSL
jgi:hypothetical protein